MPNAGGRDHLRPGTSAPKPKKPTPDNDMDIPEDDPFATPRKEKKKKAKKKSKSRRALMQVDRTFTPKEWQTIARSMDDRRRPYAGVPVGRARVGGWRKLKPKPAFRPYAPHIPVRRPYAPRRFRPHGIHGGMRR